MRDPETGKGGTVPSDMTYQERKGKYVDKTGGSGIITLENSKAVSSDVLLIGRIDKDLYSCVTKDIFTDEVVITNERIQHIKDHHPNDYERFSVYLKEIVERPDYIIESKRPNTALVLKEILDHGERFKLILRLITHYDNPDYKNSILTFMKIDDSEWKRLIHNKKVLYKSE